MRLANKKAVVLGAGQTDLGITNGSATCMKFALEGATVVCVDISEAAARSTVDAIEREGRKALAYVCDISDAQDLQGLAQFCASELGELDVIHNNVGINATGGLLDHSIEAWDKVVDVNLKAAFLSLRALVPLMLEKGGSIINISSIAAVRWTNHAFIAYHASKAGLNHMSTAVAMEYADRNIRSNVIMPGLMDTPRLLGHVVDYYGGDVEKMRRSRAQSVPMQRMGSPWDIANLASFLASDESRYITGVCIPVDGGLTCSTHHV